MSVSKVPPLFISYIHRQIIFPRVQPRLSLRILKPVPVRVKDRFTNLIWVITLKRCIFQERVRNRQTTKMILAQFSSINFSYHDKSIVQGFSLQLQDRCRVGLIGVNGSGKTTLLKLLTGDLAPEKGAIHRLKDLKIGYLKQTPDAPPDTDVQAVLHAPFQHLIEMEETLRRLSVRMTEDHSDTLLEQYDAGQEAFERLGGYTYPAKIRKVLQGLGFPDLDLSRSLGSFSGGEQARIMLARLLLEEPDLMLLDEPTNHLDIEAVEFLEQYLESFNGGVLFISHDRYFLDRVATTIVELAWQRCEIYNGNYSFYLKEREQRRAVQHKHFKLQQRRIEKLEEYIRRNMAAQKTKQAQCRLKELQRIDKIEDIRGSGRQMKLHLDIEKSSGQVVFETIHLSKGFDQKLLFSNVAVKLHRGEVVGIIGANGSGKSTLLRILNGDIEPDDGRVERGYHVFSAYYDQHLRDLDETRTIIDDVWKEAPRLMQQDIRDHLGRFLFSGDDVFKPIGPLSGGEKARVALAKLFLKKANLLLLDEPTNHLDLPARESLEAAIRGYPGTTVLVTHDRYLLDRIADRIWSIEDRHLEDYPGNYSEYKHLKSIALSVEPEASSDQTPETKDLKNRKAQRKARAALRKKTGKSAAFYEKEIHRLESDLAAIREAMKNPEIATDWNALDELNAGADRIRGELERAVGLWEQAAEAEEELGV